MQEEKPVFFHFDFNFAPGEDRLDIRITIPNYRIFVVREFSVHLSGGEDLSVDQAWCVLTSGGANSEGLGITANGATVPPLRPPQIFLNHITATTVPQNDGRIFAIRPSNVYLPAIEEIHALIIRHPSTARATAVISVTGTIHLYDPFDSQTVQPSDIE